MHHLLFAALQHMNCQQLIAEVGSVHDGSFGNACKLIELAAQCGANVCKFQTHIADQESLENAPAPSYFTGEKRYDYFRRTSFSKDQWSRLSEYCRQCKIKFLSSPFCIDAVKLLEDIGAEMYKIPSGEVTNIPMLRYIADLGKPVFLSSGMSTWNELDNAVQIFLGKVELTVMQCTSAYPCRLESVGLNILHELQLRYGNSIALGYSDHTKGLAAGVAAAALGASSIEKHLTFSNAMYGSDASNALEPQAFAQYCQQIRDVWKIMASPVNKDDLAYVHDMKRVFEKSIVASRSIPAGNILSLRDFDYKKPGDGFSASNPDILVGRRVINDIDINHKFSEDDFE
jgi:N-acetylneuraminate synthase